MEVYGREWCIRSYTMMTGICLPILARTVGLYCPHGAHFPLDAVWMASSTSQFAVAIAWMVLRMTTNLLDHEDRSGL